MKVNIVAAYLQEAKIKWDCERLTECPPRPSGAKWDGRVCDIGDERWRRDQCGKIVAYFQYKPEPFTGCPWLRMWCEK